MTFPPFAGTYRVEEIRVLVVNAFGSKASNSNFSAVIRDETNIRTITSPTSPLLSSTPGTLLTPSLTSSDQDRTLEPGEYLQLFVNSPAAAGNEFILLTIEAEVTPL